MCGERGKKNKQKKIKIAPFGSIMASIGLSWIWRGVKKLYVYNAAPLIISGSWLPENELHYYQMTHL